MLELYRIYRSYEEHENLLLNQRVTWLITVQSVLIAAFAFMIHKNYELAEKIVSSGKPYPSFTLPDLDVNASYVLYVIATVGTVFAALATLGVVTAVVAQNRVRARWLGVKRDNSLHSTLAQLPPLAGGGNPWAERLGGAFAVGIPAFFVILWIIGIGALIFYPEFFGVSRFFVLPEAQPR